MFLNRAAPNRHALAAALLMAGSALTAGCASHGPIAGRPAAFPGAPRTDWGAAPGASFPAATVILQTALALEGRPYLYGGADPDGGFDCSGLVWYVFAVHHLSLPRTTIEQSRIGQPIESDRIEPGDLVFFETAGPGPSHVGIALDRQTIIHAPSTGAFVRIERFDTPYWRTRLVGARRVTGI
jgi:cell wall-associated NlpC family hydrolase